MGTTLRRSECCLLLAMNATRLVRTFFPLGTLLNFGVAFANPSKCHIEIPEAVQSKCHHLKILSQAEIVHGFHDSVLEKLQWRVLHIIIEHDQTLGLNGPNGLRDIHQDPGKGMVPIDIEPIEVAIRESR